MYIYLRYCRAQSVQAPIHLFLRPAAKPPRLLTEVPVPPNYSPALLSVCSLHRALNGKDCVISRLETLPTVLGMEF